MGVRVRCRNENPIVTVGVKNVAATKKARQVRLHVKVVLTVFFDSEGVVHYEFLPQGRAVERSIFWNLCNVVVRQSGKRPDAWRVNLWMLNMTTRPQFIVPCPDFLAKHSTTVRQQPPYSQDLAKLKTLFP